MGNIARRSDGRWRARYRDDEGKQHARHFDRKIDGTRWLAEVETSRGNGTYIDPREAQVTLAAFYEGWSARQVWASTTVRAMGLAMRSVPFRTTAVGAIRRSHFEAWVKAMDSAGLAPSTIRTRFNNVRSVVRAAKRDRLIAIDPSEGVTLPRQRKREHSMAMPSPEQVQALLEAAEPWYRPFVALCAFAGLRLGEAAAVQLSDVDFLRQRIHVQRQVQRLGGGRVEISPPKHGSERHVPLPRELGEQLARHAEVIGTYGFDGWLFVGQDGQPPHQNTAGHWWRTTCKRAGVEGIRLHDLRHFYASGLIAAGCDVVTVQRALGHASATTTLRTYAHLFPDAEDITRAAAEGLMRRVAKQNGDQLGTEAAQ